MTASAIVDHHDPTNSAIITSPDNDRHKQLIDALNLADMESEPDYGQQQQRPMSPSFALDGILSEGDLVGEGIPLQGQILSRVQLDTIRSPTSHSRANSISTSLIPDEAEPSPTFQVVRKLGTGSYAVVYLVREVISPPSSPPSSPSDSSKQDEGVFEFDSSSSSSSPPSPRSPTLLPRKRPPQLATGREFAIKCLSKANLDADALRAQLLEATLHQSLRIHPNIVTLHRTLESSGFLLLVLEYVPGQDLFYFLEQSRDHIDPYETLNSPPLHLSKTPTTPSLLSALHPSTLLSHTRLRLIASMFGQMCDAVAACHAQGVYHRDIKPENFIVTEAWDDATNTRRVVVKLTDFGLATTEEESADMDCGSAPYMSYECRNNLAPTYTPREADVWSLGIVLINMLYHHNPWTDTSLLPEFKCPSFETYLQLEGERRDDFFMKRFVGMSKSVASFLAHRVFSFVVKGEERVSALHFGEWARRLPELFGRDPSGSTTTTAGLSISRVGRSRRPSLRSTGPSWIGFGRRETSRGSEMARSETGPPMPDPEIDDDDKSDDDAGSRATSTRRRKRGARNKSKGAQTPRGEEEFSSIAGGSERDREIMMELLVGGDRLDDMAVRSQLLARELSKASSWLSTDSSKSASKSAVNLAVTPDPEPVEPVDAKASTKKKGWKGLWRMASSDSLSASRPDASSPPPPVPTLSPPHTAPAFHPQKQAYPHSRSIPSATKSSDALSVKSDGSDLRKGKARDREPPESSAGRAANVASIVNGLSPQPRRPSGGEELRGRKSRHPPNYPPTTWGPAPRIEFVPTRPSTAHPNPYNSSARRDSQQWRNSMATTTSTSTTTTTSSAFTRYSNGSARSLETVATSASGHSSKSNNWRSGADGKDIRGSAVVGGSTPSSPNPPTPTGSGYGSESGSPTTPANIKFMNGVPWELGLLPRQLHPRPEGDIFGSPPKMKSDIAKQGRNHPPQPRLSTISEQQPMSAANAPSWRSGNQSPPAKNGAAPLSPGLGQRLDASTSTTDLGDAVDDDDEGNTKKVRKGQITALAKMLSGLRR